MKPVITRRVAEAIDTAKESGLPVIAVVMSRADYATLLQELAMADGRDEVEPVADHKGVPLAVVPEFGEPYAAVHAAQLWEDPEALDGAPPFERAEGGAADPFVQFAEL